MPKLTIQVPWHALCSKNDKYVGRFSKVLSPQYRDAQELAGTLALAATKKQKWKQTDKAVRLHAVIIEPDHRRRDPYNLGECILDALTKCAHDAVWWDDSQARIVTFESVVVDKEKAGATITIETL
jgi:Holliday junction resolvase RusA-like endonuclease